MINSLSELDEAIKNGQQFEFKNFDNEKWEAFSPLEIMITELGDIISLINHAGLRVKQVRK